MRRLSKPLLAIIVTVLLVFSANAVFADEENHIGLSYGGQYKEFVSLYEVSEYINEDSSEGNIYEIKILSNYVDNSSTITFVDKDVEIDLAGHTCNTAQAIRVMSGKLTVTSSTPGQKVGEGGALVYNSEVSGQDVYDATIINYGGTVTIDGNVSIAHTDSGATVDDFALSNFGDDDSTDNVIIINQCLINGLVYNNNVNPKNSIVVSRLPDSDVKPPVFCCQDYAFVDASSDHKTNTKVAAGIYRKAIFNKEHIVSGYTNIYLHGNEYSEYIDFNYDGWYLISMYDIEDYVARNRERDIYYTKLQFGLDDVNTGETVELLRELEKLETPLKDGRTDIREEITDFKSDASYFTLTGETEKTGVIHTLCKVDETDGLHYIFNLDKPGVKINFFNIIFDNNNSDNDCLHFKSGTYEFNNGSQIIGIPSKINNEDTANAINVETGATVIVDAKIPDALELEVENTIEMQGKLHHADGNDNGEIIIYNGAFVLKPDDYDGKTKYKDIADVSTIVDNIKYVIGEPDEDGVIERDEIWAHRTHFYAVIVGERRMPYSILLSDRITMYYYLKDRKDLEDKVIVSVDKIKKDAEEQKYDIYKDGVLYNRYSHVLTPQDYGGYHVLTAYKLGYNNEDVGNPCYYIMYNDSKRSLENYAESMIKTYSGKPGYAKSIEIVKTCVNYGKAVLDNINSELPEDQKIDDDFLVHKHYDDVDLVPIPKNNIKYTSYGTTFLKDAQVSMEIRDVNKVIISLADSPSSDYSYNIVSSSGRYDTPNIPFEDEVLDIETKPLYLSGNGIHLKFSIVDSQGNTTETLELRADDYLYRLVGDNNDVETAKDVAIWLHTLGVRINEKYGK